MPGRVTIMVRAFLSIRPLAPACRPCHVTRHGDMTLLAVHPGVSKIDVIWWVVEHLTPEENCAYRRAYGEQPVGQHLSDAWMMDEPFDLEVPPVLQTPAEQRRQALVFAAPWPRGETA